MDWFKKHVDTVAVISAIVGSMVWMNGKFSDIDSQFSDIEKEIVVIKTVLIMKDVMPKELASTKEGI